MVEAEIQRFFAVSTLFSSINNVVGKKASWGRVPQRGNLPREHTAGVTTDWSVAKNEFSLSHEEKSSSSMTKNALFAATAA
jgi:hypothetical protein